MIHLVYHTSEQKAILRNAKFCIIHFTWVFEIHYEIISLVLSDGWSNKKVIRFSIGAQTKLFKPYDKQCITIIIIIIIIITIIYLFHFPPFLLFIYLFYILYFFLGGRGLYVHYVRVSQIINL